MSENIKDIEADDLTKEDYKEIAKYLYQLLDDIDTADDLAKDNEKMYRNLVRKKQALKSVVGHSPDGYVIKFNKPPVILEKDRSVREPVQVMN